MKAIVIYEEEFSSCGYEYECTVICRVIAITDEQLAQIDVIGNDVLRSGQKYDIVDLEQARIETKTVLAYGLQ
jgi:hypothetical protein